MKPKSLESFAAPKPTHRPPRFVGGRVLAVGFVVFALLASMAFASPRVRLLVAEEGHPDLSQVSCPQGPGIYGSCRVLMEIVCPESGPCQENVAGPIDDHATVVTKLAAQTDPDVELIVASGNPKKALAWAVANQERFNIRVVNRTDGRALGSPCSSDSVFSAAANKGIAVVHSAGNQGTNGIDQPIKSVISDACGPQVLAIGFLGNGFVTGQSPTHQCSDDAPPGGDNTSYNLIPIDCQANARPGDRSFGDPFVEIFVNGQGVPPNTDFGSSFAAPKVAALAANYLTQNPSHGVRQVRQYLLGNGIDLTVDSWRAGVFDRYRQILPARVNQLHQTLSATAHQPSAGYFYNPERPGWGLHVSTTVGNQAYLIWYTYDSQGNPVWYTSYGVVSGGVMTGAIRKERKLPGQPSTGTNVGCIRLDFVNPTAFNFGWNFSANGNSCWHSTPMEGSERVEKLLGNGSGIGGQWYNPMDSGWGFSVEASMGTAGDELLTLFYFDADGEPIWASGQPETAKPMATMPMLVFQGFCQGCPYMPATSEEVGTLTHNLMTGDWGLYTFGNVTINIEDGADSWPPPSCSPVICPMTAPIVNIFP